MEEDTANLTLAYAASTNSSGIEGRAICNARTNHWVSDDGGGDAVYSGELFLSGIPSCAVNMVERLARTDNIVLEWMEVSLESYRDADADHGDFTLYDAIRIKFEMWGVEDEDALSPVELWKKR
jgi:uncharacterized OsmC-like protein